MKYIFSTTDHNCDDLNLILELCFWVVLKHKGILTNMYTHNSWQIRKSWWWGFGHIIYIPLIIHWWGQNNVSVMYHVPNVRCDMWHVTSWLPLTSSSHYIIMSKLHGTDWQIRLESRDICIALFVESET